MESHTRDSSATAYAAAMLLLTAACGVLDAASYLALDRVFTGNMTGNVLFIGFGLAGADDIPVVNNVVALVAFMAGAAIGARATRTKSPTTSLPRNSVVVISISTVATYVVSVFWMLTPALSTPAILIVTAILALVLGAQAAAVTHLAIREYSTVVVTMTIVSMASESRLGRRVGGSPQARRAAVIVAMATGAAVGAAAWRLADGAVALLIGAVIMTIAIPIIVWARRIESR